MDSYTFKRVVTEDGEFKTEEDKELLKSYFKASPWNHIKFNGYYPSGIEKSNFGN